MKYPVLLYIILQSLVAVVVPQVSKAQEKSNATDMSQYILTPEAPDTPRINGPEIYGERPGRPFLFRIPVTGVRPMTFFARNLPKGLNLDEATGIITGKVAKAGTYNVRLKATNRLGSCEKNFRIVIGDRIALTPPMGWNSWNCWGNTVSQKKVLSSAKAMVDRGLADYGWSYINIDDGWQGKRGGKYNAIMPNGKFPDIAGLSEEIHAMGLKFGIYSTPWAGTYAGHIGGSCDNQDGTYDWIKSGKHNENYRYDHSREHWYYGKYDLSSNDVKQWAEWGLDYLKYDWDPNDEYSTETMSDLLSSSGRDIILSLSNSAPFAGAPCWMKYAECWRTTGDIRDEWKNMSGIGFHGQDRWAPYKGPGHWPDADMLVVGQVGWGDETHPSRLTADEQYTHISLWALLASPLLIGCDIADMDDFTFSLLSNNEVIGVNQDPLGVQASKIAESDSCIVYAKPLEDGSIAVGLFNLSSTPRIIGFTPKSLGISDGNQTIRDLWRQKNMAVITGVKEKWEISVAPHGVELVRVLPGITGERKLGRYRK